DFSKSHLPRPSGRGYNLPPLRGSIRTRLSPRHSAEIAAQESEHLAKGEIDPSTARQWMLSVFERSDTVINKPRGSAPHNRVAAFEPQPADRIRTAFTAPEEHGRQAKRDGDDGSPRILFIAILMKAQFGAGGVAIDQTGVWIITFESCLRCRTSSEIEER